MPHSALELLVATRSADKLAEIQAILKAAARASLITLRDLDVPQTDAEDDIEAHDTFTANAVAKARYFARLTGRPTLADDSGLCVQALGGGPGVRTRRFAIDHGAVDAGVSGKALDAANNALLLEELTAVPDQQRTAYYVCAAAFCRADGTVLSTLATCSGVIARSEKGAGGFGYDPLFLLAELGVTFAELSSNEKHARSHRARAFRALAAHLK